MKIPTYEEAERLFSTYHVPQNFLLHCKKVAHVGRFLATEPKKKGFTLDVEVIERGCLLHDLFKFATLDELKENKKFKANKPTREEITSWKKLKKKYLGKHEVEIFYEIFHKKYPELSLLIKHASDHERVVAQTSKRTWEERVMHYADARVLGDQIVTLQKRMEDGFKRYKDKMISMGIEEHEKEKKILEEDEKEIFSSIGVSPGILLLFNTDPILMTVNSYDQGAEKFYEATKEFQDHQLYMKDLNIAKGNKILDAGCGYGRDCEALRKKGVNIIGIDLSKTLLQKAKQIYPSCTFKQMDLRKLNFPKNTFDAIICNATLLHLPRQEIGLALTSLFNVLKPRGKLWLGVKKGKGEGYELRRGLLSYIVYFNAKEIKEDLQNSGFLILKLYENTEKRKEEKIRWINILAQKPERKKQIRKRYKQTKKKINKGK